MTEIEKDKKELFLDKNIISSTHISFLFGAGVNGKGFPQLSGFTKTLDEIAKYAKSKNFEEMVNEITDENLKKNIIEIFKKEFDEKAKNINFDDSALVNLKNLLVEIYTIVDKTQNRNIDMKQINIFSLNYDNIVETILQNIGYFYNSISASNINEKSSLLNVVGYDYSSKRYIPTYQVCKLHGDINNPVFPGKEKYQQALDADFFEVIFNMKELLNRPNSILIVIGYSGNDEHINRILKESIQKGLTVFWYSYCEEDNKIEILENLTIKTKIVNKNIDDCSKDSTEACFEDLRSILEI